MKPPRGPLLHNMSAPPRTVIDHPIAKRRLHGRGAVFTMPDLGEEPTAAALLSILDGAPCRLPTAAAETELRRRLDANARRLALPAAAVVTPQRSGDDRDCGALLDVLTVLAKASEHVYLRDKEPNLSGFRAGRRVIVLAI
jgi:hypothetical protein